MEGKQLWASPTHNKNIYTIVLAPYIYQLASTQQENNDDPLRWPH